MEDRGTKHGQPAGLGRRNWRTAVILIACYWLGTAAIGAASVPAWLDAAITEWNQENPKVQIQFVEIKDSFVWYMVPNTPETGHVELRESIYGIVQRHGYQRTEAEELVTTGRPPSPNKSGSRDKKCWKRSFTLDLEVGRQRLLTTQVCADTTSWLAGFRVAG